MGTRKFTTRCATIIVYGNSRVRVISDGLIESQEMTLEEVQIAFERLKQEGWNLVSSIDRDCSQESYPITDIYFRRESVKDPV